MEDHSIKAQDTLLNGNEEHKDQELNEQHTLSKKRSYIELSDRLFTIINEFDDEHSARISVRDLPALIERIEQEQNVILFEDQEKIAVQDFSEKYPELDVSAEEMIEFIAKLQHRDMDRGRTLEDEQSESAESTSRKYEIQENLNLWAESNLLPRSKSNPVSPESTQRQQRRRPSLSAIDSPRFERGLDPVDELHRALEKDSNMQSSKDFEGEMKEELVSVSSPLQYRAHLPRRLRKAMTSSPMSDNTIFSSAILGSDSLLQEEELSPNSSFDDSFFMDAKSSELRGLHRESVELAKIYKDAHISATAAVDHLELQLKSTEDELETIKQELNAKKKELFEMKAKEVASQKQIFTLETNITNLVRTLEEQQALYSTLKKKHDEKSSETESLRLKVTTIEKELTKVESRNTSYRTEVAKWNTERERFEHKIMELETALQDSSEKEIQLDKKLLENIKLQENLERLREELDETRLGSLRSRLLKTPEPHSVPVLSAELEDDSDGVVETPSMISRKKKKKKHGSLGQIKFHSVSSNDSRTKRDNDIGIQADDLTHERFEPLTSHLDKSELQNTYDAVTQQLGIKCQLMQSQIDSNQSVENIEPESFGLRNRKTSNTDKDAYLVDNTDSSMDIDSRLKYIYQLYEHLQLPFTLRDTILLYTLMIWLLGFVTASLLLPSDVDYSLPRYYSSDWKTFAKLNSYNREHEIRPSPTLVHSLTCKFMEVVEWVLFGPLPSSMPARCDR